MKKTVLTLSLALAASLAATAQTYNFSQSTEAYAPLTGATMLSGTGYWDDEEYTSQIGFTFTVGNTQHTTLRVDSNGFLTFGTPGNERVIFGMQADLEDRGNTTSASPISTSLTGSAGSRIRKYEWKNAGFLDGASSDFANFQIWLHEGTNAISVHYGTSSFVNVVAAFDDETGPIVGVLIENSGSTSFSGILLSGPAASPTANQIAGSTSLSYLTGVPANGTVYNFSTGVTATADELLAVQLQVFPNPAADVLYVDRANGATGAISVRVLDLLGREVLAAQTAQEQRQQVRVSGLATGTYVLEVKQDGARALRKFVKN